MKRLLLFTALLFSFVIGFAQSLQTTTKERVSIILPTIENFIYLSNCSEEQFSSIMKQYHYSESDCTAELVSYQASLDNFIVHAVTSYDRFFKSGNIICWLWRDEMYPINAMSTIYSKLRPHYIGKDEDGLEKFAFNYNGRAYGILISSNEKCYIIRTLKFGDADARLSELI